MKRYTPSRESVCAEWMHKMRLQREAKHAKPKSPRLPIPDNSEPWLPHPPRSIGDLLYIADQVARLEEQISKSRRVLPPCQLPSDNS